MQAAAAAHRANAVGWLKRTDQHGTGRAFLLADEIHAPMDAVGTLDVSEAWGAEHHPVARCRAAERMRGRIVVMIGVDLDDDAADDIEQQRRADQVWWQLMHTAVKN